MRFPRADATQDDVGKCLVQEEFEILIEYKSVEVWYASDRRARSCLKLIVFDAAGRLSQNEKSLEFQGRKATCFVDEIESIDLVRQTPNWPLQLVAGVVAYLMLTMRGHPPMVVIPIVIVIMALSVMIANVKWIRVNYRDADGKLTGAWFADGNNFGWGGILGGNAKLYERILQNMKPAAPSILSSVDNESRGS